MREITIQTYATWEQINALIAVHNTPIELLARIINTSNNPIRLNGACICIKRSMWFDKDWPTFPMNVTINSRNNYELQYNMRPFVQKYGVDKRFTVKVFTNIGVFESDVLTIRLMENAAAAFRQ